MLPYAWPAAGSSGALALVEGRDDRPVQMGAGDEVRDWGPGLERSSALLAGRAHEAAHGLNGQVDGQLAGIRARATEAGSGGVDQPGIHRVENLWL